MCPYMIDQTCLLMYMYIVNSSCISSALSTISLSLFIVSFIQDRVIINRLDSICHAILKGKWPSSSQYESHSTLANTCVPNSAHQRAAFMPARVQPAQSLNFSMPAPVSRMPKVNYTIGALLYAVHSSFRSFSFICKIASAFIFFPLKIIPFCVLPHIVGEVDSPSILARPQTTRSKTTV